MAPSYVVSRIVENYPNLHPKDVEESLAYGSFASLENRFVYIEVPKAACTAMKMLFRELHNSAPLKLFVRNHRETRRNMFVHARENLPLPPLTALGEKDQRDLFEGSDVLRFTIVRNPYNRLVSAWRDKVLLCEPTVENVYAAVRGTAPAMDRKHPIEFSEFVSYLESRVNELWNGHWRQQVALTFPKAIDFTHVGKTESLDATISILGRHLAHNQAIAIPRVNEGTVKAAARWSEELARRVYALYEDDFTRFGYDKQSWLGNESDNPSTVSEERYIDEVTERNVIIAHLYRERDRLSQQYNDAYRFSLKRAKNLLRRVVRPHGQL